MITGLIVKNYKIFDKEHFIELKPLTLFTGTNNSGKSSILNIFNILKLIFHKDQSLANLYENGIDLNLVKAFNKYYGGFNNLFNNASNYNDMIIGFRWHEKKLDTDLYFKFTFSKDGKLLEYVISDALNRDGDEPESDLLIEDTTAENGTPPLPNSILVKCTKEQEYIQINYVKINQIITKAEKRNITHEVVCQKLIHFVNSNLVENLRRDAEIYFADSLSKIGNLRIFTDKSALKDYISNKKQNDIESLHSIFLNFDELNISESVTINLTNNFDNIFPISEFFTGLAFNSENNLLKNLELSEELTAVYINNEGKSLNVFQLIEDALKYKTDQIRKNILQPFLEKKLDEFKETQLSVLIKSFREEYKVDIEMENNDDFFDDLFLFDKFGTNQCPYSFSYYDKLAEKTKNINIHDAYYDFDGLDLDHYLDITFDTFNYTQFIGLLEDGDREMIYSIYKKYYTDCTININEFAKTFNDILCGYYSKVQFSLNHIDYWDSPFSVERTSNRTDRSISSILNYVSKYNFGYLYPNWSNTFYQFIDKAFEYEKAIDFITESDDLFLDTSGKYKELLEKLATFLIGFEVEADFDLKDKLFLTELYFLLFKKLNTNKIKFHFSKDAENVLKHFKDFFGCDYSEFTLSKLEQMQQGKVYLERKKFLNRYISDFHWLSSELSSVYVTNTNKISESRTNILSSDDDLSRIINDYNVLSKTDQEKVLLLLKNSLTKMEICDEIQLDIQPLTDNFSIYIIRNERKTLLQDNGYGLINLVMPLLFLAIKKVTGADGVFVLKEPEIALHPALQSKLADVFVDFLTDYRSYHSNGDLIYTTNGMILIETHSEYLIRKLQYLTVGSGKQMVGEPVHRKMINNKDIVIYYFSYPQYIGQNDARIKKIIIKENGSLSDNFGSGFFDESGNIVYELIRIQTSNNN